MLHIYDSRTRRKEAFAPLDPEGRVRLYWCGPTVYDRLHVGHARAAIVPDMVRRYLEYRGYLVRYVTNFTDVDDKIIRRALETGRPWRELTLVHIDEYHRSTAALGNRPADAHPRATDHIPEMRAIVSDLLSSGHAYVASDGDVYYDTAACSDYGALSHRRLDDQQVDREGRIGEGRLAVKRHPGDFIVWKLLANDPEEWRQAGPERIPGWDSPWGRGRPGWHLECSALSRAYLGVPFDIHGGGLDLMFPHHENERAQNHGAFAGELCGAESVRVWMHNGFVQLPRPEAGETPAAESDADDPTKISKSKGNVVWLDDVVWPNGPYDPMALRLMMLASHYRSPIPYHEELVAQQAARLERTYAALDELDAAGGTASGAPPPEVGRHLADFETAMDDDFSTPQALAALSRLIGEAGEHGRAGSAAHAAAAARRMMRTLGLREQRAALRRSAAEGPLLDLLLELRKSARAAKQFALSDRVRDALTGLGYELRDRPDGGTEIARR